MPSASGTKRITQFSVGRVWRCNRDRDPFDFLVIGPGAKPGWVRCRIVPHGPDTAATTNFSRRALSKSPWTEQDYTKNHIKKHAVLVPLTLDDFAQAMFAEPS